MFIIVQQEEDIIPFVGIRVLLAFATLDHLSQLLLVQIDVFIASERNRPKDQRHSRRQGNWNLGQLEGCNRTNNEPIHFFRYSKDQEPQAVAMAAPSILRIWW